MSFVAVAIGGSAVAGVAGAAISSSAARDAADKQSAASDRATALQEKMYNQTRDDNAAYRNAGYGALSDMGSQDFKRDFTAADFQQDPGYDFRMQEGQKALERSAAARGGLQSGGTMKALAQYGQNFASNEYGNAYNRFNQDRDRRFGRLSNISGMGIGANNSNAISGQNYANNAGSNMMGAANAQGAAGIAGANAWSGALSGIGKAGMDYAAMNNQPNWMSKTTGAQNTNTLSGMNYNQSANDFWGK
jgi:hypothetical protein